MTRDELEQLAERVAELVAARIGTPRDRRRAREQVRASDEVTLERMGLRRPKAGAR